jgi:hypothetical protein
LGLEASALLTSCPLCREQSHARGREGASQQPHRKRESRHPDEVIKDAKKPWTMQIEGQIETKYLFGTVLAKNLVPFVVRQFSLVALPLRLTKRGGDLIMIDADEALSQGDRQAYDWFSQADRIWEKKRKAEHSRCPSGLTTITKSLSKIPKPNS